MAQNNKGSIVFRIHRRRLTRNQKLSRMQINLPVDSTRPRHRRQLIISRKEDPENTLRVN